MASSYQQAEQPESFLRSAQMSRVQLLLPAESVRNVVEQLGQLERISFDDVSTASFIAGSSRLIVVLLHWNGHSLRQISIHSSGHGRATYACWMRWSAGYAS